MRITCLALSLIVIAANAQADGMSFSVVGAEAEVRATEQRAILYLPGAQADWQLHIQPVFDRDAGAAAWVVPFPVQPTVSEGSADFFDQLEVLTAPVFMRMCAESSSGGCMGCADDGALNGKGVPLGGSSLVTVWEKDVVGDLDYVILSAANGDSLTTWLTTEGYELGSEAEAILSDFETEGVFWFAARLSATADPAKPISPVRFDLPGVDEPSYPMRLTALGVPDGQTLGLTLWVISHQDVVFAPDNQETFSPWPSTRTQFDSAVESFFEDSPDSLLTLFGGNFNNANEKQVCDEMGICVSYDELDLEAPDTWCPEIQTIIDLNQWVVRYEGRLGPASMTEDLLVREQVDSYQIWASRVYTEYTCEDEASADWILLLGVGLGLLLRRRRA